MKDKTKDLIVVDPIQVDVDAETKDAKVFAGATIKPIEDNEEYQELVEVLQSIKGRYKLLEAKEKELTAGINASLQSIRAMFKPAKTFYKRAEDHLKGAILVWRNEEKKRQDKELKQAVKEGKAIEIKKPEAPKGIAFKSQWKARVVDENAVPREYLIPDILKLNRIATVTGGGLDIPGVEFYEETIVASGSK